MLGCLTSNNSPASMSTQDSDSGEISLLGGAVPDYKSGSLQEFVKSIGPIENFSPDLFSVDEIHKIAVLDLRLLNLD